MESELGWGTRLDETLDFGDSSIDHERAVAYVKGYNSVNNKSIIPDWYMYADGPHWVDKE